MRTFKILSKPGRAPLTPGLPLGLPELTEPAVNGPPGAKAVWWSQDGADDDWLALGQLGLQLGYRVTVLGSPWRTVQRDDGLRERVERPEVIGLTLTRNAGRERCTLLRQAVLGDVSTEEATHYGVSSAGQLGALLARAELGDYPVPMAVQRAATLCSWAGPMLVYRALATDGARKWDQRKAYLGAWAQPMPARGAEWTHRDAPAWDATPILRGMRTGFMVARILQCGPYPSWPAAVAGDRLRVPLAGYSVVSIPVYSAALLEACDLLRVVDVIADFIAPADPELGYRVQAHYEGHGKAVYQRTHAALTPCPRYAGRLKMSGAIDWSLQQPDPRRSRPDVASLLRSFVATRTAAFLATLPEDTALAAHIDAVYECSGRSAEEHANAGLPVELGAWTADAEEARPGDWLTHFDPAPGRFYAPGRWHFGAEAPCMGGSQEALGPDPVFLRARDWSGDPRWNPAATSRCRAAEDAGWYDYAWPGREIEGNHG